MGSCEDEVTRRWEAAKKLYWTHLKKVLFFFKVPYSCGCERYPDPIFDPQKTPETRKNLA